MVRAPTDTAVATINENNDDQVNERFKILSVTHSAGSACGRWDARLSIGGKEILFKLDTGAELNILPMRLARELIDSMPSVRLVRFPVRLLSYFGDSYSSEYKAGFLVVGAVQSIESFHVVDRDVCPTICGDTAEALGLLKRVQAMTVATDPELIALMTAYPSVFTGKGCIKNFKCSIQLKPGYQAVKNSCRTVPVAYQQAVREELKRMEQLNVIKRETEPTEFVSNIVVVVKNTGKLRICLDPTNLNKAIARGPHPMKCLDQVVSKLFGARYFTVLDCSEGFWQIPLDERASKLCTFITPWGRYRFTRMPYGIISASNVFQQFTDVLFQDLEGATCVVDDILCWGRDKAELNERVHDVLRRCQEAGLVLNPKKCQISKTVVRYLGHTLSHKGLSICKDRVQGIANISAPKSQRELLGFLGMLGYVSQFIPSFADKTAPLRELIKKDASFVWDIHHEQAFIQLKTQLMTAPVLKFFDPNRPVVLSVDASQFGVGAVLLQDGQPIAYASRSLTETQKGMRRLRKSY